MIRERIFRITPLGRAESDVKKYLEENSAKKEELKRYEITLEKYRSAKIVHIIVKSLLYASVITSVAATIGLDQARILEKLASYIGVGLILVIYALSKYLVELYRESYHVQREILIADATRETEN